MAEPRFSQTCESKVVRTAKTRAWESCRTVIPIFTQLIYEFSELEIEHKINGFKPLY